MNMLSLILQDAATPATALNLLASLAVGFLGSLALGGAKKVGGKWQDALGVADNAITKAIKPAQPLVLVGLTYALPLLGAKLGIVPPEASDMVNAPLAAIFGVVAREVGLRLFKKKEPTA